MKSTTLSLRHVSATTKNFVIWMRSNYECLFIKHGESIVSIMARPSKLTPETQQAIINALNSGNWIETAANYAGIAVATLYNWLDRGKLERERLDNDEEPIESEAQFVEFLEAVEKSRSQAQVRAVGLIQKAAIDGTWQAAAWFLERSDPQRWGRFNRMELTGKDGGSVAVDVTKLEEKVRTVLNRAESKNEQ